MTDQSKPQTPDTPVRTFQVPDPARWLHPETAPPFPCAFPDPTGYFRQVSPEMTLGDVAEFTGLIPDIFSRAVDQHIAEIETALETNVHHAAARADTKSLAWNLEHADGFPAPPMTGGTVGDDGIYRYPGDDDLHPILALRHPFGAQCLIYEYGITAVRFRAGDWYVTRLD